MYAAAGLLRWTERTPLPQISSIAIFSSFTAVGLSFYIFVCMCMCVYATAIACVGACCRKTLTRQRVFLVLHIIFYFNDNLCYGPHYLWVFCFAAHTYTYIKYPVALCRRLLLIQMYIIMSAGGGFTVFRLRAACCCGRNYDNRSCNKQKLCFVHKK